MSVLSYPARSVVLVAGLPGAGKTTLLRRVGLGGRARVLDTDDVRAGGARWRPWVYLRHYARLVQAVGGEEAVVVHGRGTRRPARRLVTALARATGREAHLLLLDVDRKTAEAGQRERGRRVSRRELDAEALGWQVLLDRLGRRPRADDPLGEGWSSVTVLDRRGAGAVALMDFLPTPGADEGVLLLAQ
ncbi:MAG TPA: AAA family ATPase [Solirubrobacteraceae bacterium]|nr:AAA family ATPase [Solirubrobacteraceae bacterium]